MNTTAKKKPVLLKLRSGKRFVVFVVSMAVFTDIFLYGLIVPVFPFALEEKVGITHDSIQRWVSVLLAVYAAGLLVASPVCGFLADRVASRRVPFMAGLVTLAGATAMLCAGNSIAMMVAGRLLQGVSAAVVWVVGLALLVDTVGPDEVGTSMGVVSVAISMGIFLAPLLGGVVYERGGYYAVFAMAFAMIAVDIVLRVVVIERKTAKLYDDPLEETEATATSTDVVLEEVTATSTPIDQVAEPEVDQTDEKTPKWIKRLPPVITLMAHPRLLNALWASLIQAALTTGFETTLPLFVRDTFGFGPTGAGLVFLPIITPSFLSPLVGMMCDRYGPRFFATAGFVLLVPFMILLRLPTHDTVNQIVLFCALLTLVGTAFALLLAPMMAEITLVVLDLEEKKPGRFGANGAFAQAYSLFNVAFAGGSLVGPLLAGLLNEAAGWKTVTLVLGLLCVFTAVPTFLWTGGFIRKQDLGMSRPTT